MKIGEANTDYDMRAQRASQPKKAAEPVMNALPETARQKPAAPPVEIPKIESVTRQIDSYLRSINRSLQFRVDQASGEMIVSIFDAETGEVIRQVPGEEAVRMAQRIEAQLSAMLDEKA